MDARCSHDHDTPGLKGAALTSAMAGAADRCARVGERMTEPRRRVLEQLLSAGDPVKAYDLIASYGAAGAAAKPPTVYRALEFLERMGFAHRIESLSAYVACRHGEDDHAAAFLICDCCGATREIEPAGARAMIDAGTAAGYQIQRMTIEAHGLCGACRPRV